MPTALISLNTLSKMFLKQMTLAVALHALSIVLVLQPSNAEKIRLCGKRLADMLNYVCEKHGGFHVPSIKRDGK